MKTDGEMLVMAFKLAKLAKIDQGDIARELNIGESTISRIANNTKSSSEYVPALIEYFKEKNLWPEDSYVRPSAGESPNWSLIAKDLRHLADILDNITVSDFEKGRRIFKHAEFVSETLESLKPSQP